MRFDKVWTVAKKDMAEFRTNKYIMYSLILMPLLMTVVLPVIYLTPFTMSTSSNEPWDLGLSTNQTIEGQSLVGGVYNDTRFVDCQLEGVVAERCFIERTTLNSSLVRFSYMGNSTLSDGAIMHSNVLHVNLTNVVSSELRIIGEESESVAFLNQFINFLLIFFVLIPAILPTVIASYSFVGEKLNRSLEPLLATPTTDAELLTGKSLSIFLPTIVITWLSFIPFVLIVNFLATPVLGHAPLPDATWLIGVFLLAPLFCVLTIALNVIVSSRVNDVRASQQIGSVVVLPIVMLFVVGLAGLFTLGPLTMLIITAGVAAVAVVVSFVTLRTFQREEILIRWK